MPEELPAPKPSNGNALKGKRRREGDPPDWRSKPRKPLTLKKTCTIAIRCTAQEAELIRSASEHYQLTTTDLVIDAIKHYTPSKYNDSRK
jgi:hypothetical protein